MTGEQFYALREWIDARTRIAISIASHPNDRPRVEREYEEIQELDRTARTVLVEPDDRQIMRELMG